MSTPLHDSPLGRPTPYVDRYDPSLLFPIDRAEKRRELGLAGALPFVGADLWNAYEVSWLDPRGKPQVALARVAVPCESTHIVESKSFKLYLNSFSAEPLPDAESVRARIQGDLSAVVWHGGAVRQAVDVALVLPGDFGREAVVEPAGINLDALEVSCTHREPAPELLASGGPEVREVLASHLLKSNCPVTGQPDWASVALDYEGPAMDREGLLRYLVSFRHHGDFHEHCVERIFMDVWQRCRPRRLSVIARYTRRGGLDINPWRSSHPQARPSFARTARQ